MIKHSLRKILVSDNDPDQLQNLVSWPLHHCWPSLRILKKYVHNFLCEVAKWQTDKQALIILLFALYCHLRLGHTKWQHQTSKNLHDFEEALSGGSFMCWNGAIICSLSSYHRSKRSHSTTWCCMTVVWCHGFIVQLSCNYPMICIIIYACPKISWENCAKFAKILKMLHDSRHNFYLCFRHLWLPHYLWYSQCLANFRGEIFIIGHCRKILNMIKIHTPFFFSCNLLVLNTMQTHSVPTHKCLQKQSLAKIMIKP